MKIFLAAVQGRESLIDWSKVSHRNFLGTFANFTQGDGGEKVKKLFADLPEDSDFLLDSGAFSVYTGKAKIDLDKYIKFLNEYGHYFWNYISLDVIRTKDISVQKSIELTIENQRIMEEAGLKPVPVYHAVSETLPYLEQLLEKYDYIFLGGMAAQGITQEKLRQLLDSVFEINKKYKKKIHGLGQTNNFVCQNYPFYSVDSTSWLQASIFNRIPYLQNDSIELKKFEIGMDTYFKGIFPTYFYDPEYISKDMYCMNVFSTWQYYITKLWELKGVKWND